MGFGPYRRSKGGAGLKYQTTPGPVKARESLSKLGSFQNDTKNRSNFKPPLTGKNRLVILEQIVERWANRGFYQSSALAMAALLGVSE
jgi:hypothetical protein